VAPLLAWTNESCMSGHLTGTHRLVLFARNVHPQFRCATLDLTANQFSVEKDWIFAKPVKADLGPWQIGKRHCG
jgi:hypothetical protein